jgi:hypothetical protein
VIIAVSESTDGGAHLRLTEVVARNEPHRGPDGVTGPQDLPVRHDLDLRRRLAEARRSAPFVGFARRSCRTAQATWSDLFDSPIQNPSIMDSRAASGSTEAPRVTNSGMKCSTVGCAYGMPGARVR